MMSDLKHFPCKAIQKPNFFGGGVVEEDLVYKFKNIIVQRNFLIIQIDNTSI